MPLKDLTESLKRCQFFEIQNARLLGGWLPGIERWETKSLAGLHLWQDAENSRELRTRLWELRTPKPDKDLGGAPERVSETLARAARDHEFLAGLYRGFKPYLVECYRRLAEESHPVSDVPTRRILQRVIADKEAQIAEMEPVLEALAADATKRREMEQWAGHVRELAEWEESLAAGETDPAECPEPPPGHSTSPLPFMDARRDERFELCFEGPPRPDPDDADAMAVYQFVNYAMEMQAAETLGSVLWETEGMDWEFYYDVARHGYDESRHSQLGENRLREMGHSLFEFPHTTTNFAWRQLIDPLHRYCLLTYVIESDSFGYKHKTYKSHMERGDHASAEAVLYDIVDETLHVRWGKKWTSELMKHYGYEGSLKDLVAECRDILMRNAVNPIQKASAERKGKNNTVAVASK